MSIIDDMENELTGEWSGEYEHFTPLGERDEIGVRQ